MTGMQPGQIILSLVGIVVIIFAAYYVTYYIGVKAQKVNRIRGRNIALLERFAISKDKSFCIVEIAGKVYVVGVTNQSMTLLDTLDAAAYAESGAKYGGEAASGFMRGARQNNLTNRLAAFLSGRMSGRPGRGEPAGSGTFRDSMDAAQHKTNARGDAAAQNGSDTNACGDASAAGPGFHPRPDGPEDDK